LVPFVATTLALTKILIKATNSGNMVDGILYSAIFCHQSFTNSPVTHWNWWMVYFVSGSERFTIFGYYQRITLILAAIQLHLDLVTWL
jgi:hypothetical protein